MAKTTEAIYQPVDSIESQIGESSSLQAVEDPVVISLKSYQISLSQLKYFTFTFLGIAFLWPWNCLLSVSSYYVVKFGDGATSRYFISTMMTVSTLGSLSFNSYLSSKQNADYSFRIKLGVVFNFFIFIILALLELLNHGEHGKVYFSFLMLLVFGSAIGTCYQQNGCMALVNVMGPKYAQGVMVGQAVAGVLPSVSLILSVLIYGANSKESGSGGVVLYFFTTAIIILVSGIFWVFTTRFDDRTLNINTFETLSSTKHVPFWTLFYKLFYIVGSIFLVFMVTLPFAPFTSNISSNNHWGQWTTDSIFIPFMYFIWNLGDLAGRVSCGYESFLISSDKKLFIYSIARFVHIPFYFLCNLYKDEDVIIPSDFFYLIIQFLFGFTNGHCLSLAFMNIGTYVDPNEREAAGGFSTVFLSLGLVFGSLFSYLFSKMVALT